MRPDLGLLPALALLLGSTALAQDAQDALDRPAPTPPELQQALAKATVHNQRVLLVLAGEGDDLLAARLRKDKLLSRPLLYEFEIAQLQGKQADTAAVHYGFAAAVNEKPALLVLDAAGKPLAQLPADQVMGEGQLRSTALLERLKPMFCAPVDAEQKLAAALAEGKKSGRAVFVRFDAPW